MILLKSSLKYFSKHYLQTLLAITGIVLGVSIVVAIDVCIESSKKAFETSIEQSFGKSTHYIYSDQNGFDDSLFTKLKTELGLHYANPVIEEYVLAKSQNSQWQRIKVLGIDPFAYKDFSLEQKNIFNNKDQSLFQDFLLCKNCALISKNTANFFNIKKNDFVELQVETEYKKIRILDIIDSKWLDNILLTDISTAQIALDSQTKLSRIDLIADKKQGFKAEDAYIKQDSLIKHLAPGIDLIPSISSKESTQKIINSFNLNLYSLSFLSLIVAIFLIYNTMSFSIIQRQTILGIFRTLGVSKRQIFGMVIFETLIITLIGSILGLALGLALSKILIQFISQTINDLYFSLQVSKLEFNSLIIAKGLIAGVLAAFAGALIPALQASHSPAVQVIQRSRQEKQAKQNFATLISIAALASIVAALLLAVSQANLILNFVALGLIIISLALMTPLFIKVIIRILDIFVTKHLNQISKIAIRSIERNLSRTSIAIAALMIALSISLSLDITVNSFRETVKDWLNGTLASDIYISAPSLRANRNTNSLSQDLIKEIEENQTIKKNSGSLVSYRSNQVSSELGPIMLASINSNKKILDSFRFKAKTSNWRDEFKKLDSIIISEPLAYKYKLKTDSLVNLKTKEGNREFKVLGIFYDYGSDQGIAMMHKAKYQKYWQDYKISSLGIMIKDELNKEKSIDAIKQTLSKINLSHNFNYSSSDDVKVESMNIFDRTFRVTEALKIIAILIAFIAIISALLALNLEKFKEYAILEALGLSKHELSWMISIQTVSMGLIAAILAIPVGIIESLLLVYVINQRSFGWTLNFHIDKLIFLEVLLLAILAAFLASLYPSFKHIRTALALRND